MVEIHFSVGPPTDMTNMLRDDKHTFSENFISIFNATLITITE